MKTLFILPEYLPSSGGGIITFYKHLIQALLKNGCEVSVLVGSGLSANTFEGILDDVKIYSISDAEIKIYHSRFSKYDIFPTVRNHLSAAYAMYEKSKTLGDFNIIECTDWGLGFVPFVLNKEKVVIQFHASEGEINFIDSLNGSELEGDIFRNIEKTILIKAPVLVAHSKHTQSFWQIELDRSDIHLQLPAFQTENLSTDKTLSSDGVVVARLQYWKGPEVLCKALKSHSLSNIKIKWIGREMIDSESGQELSTYLKMKYPSVWNKSFIYEGQKDYETTQQLIKNSRFVIVPSVWDVFNFTCIEAMSQGKVVICSIGAGASDLIENGVNGFVFESENASQLAEIIKHVSELSEEQILKIGRNANQAIREKLNPLEISKERQHIYENIKANTFYNFTDWELELVKPITAHARSIEYVLSKQPLKGLLAYIYKRIQQKYFRK